MRLAQDFAQRYPLVDGQGNFGNIDGDNAAAMRYTESRLTAVAEALLAGIDENAVDFRPTYDGENQRAGGAAGALPQPARERRRAASPSAWRRASRRTISASSATRSRHLVRKPRATVGELVELLPGSRFPDGRRPRRGTGRDRARPTQSGRGSFRLRARWEAREALSHGAYQVVVTEIPYQVQKSRLIERIAALLEEKKLPLLADVRDESTETVRLVLEPKTRNVGAGSADGIALPRDRARDARAAQHERARRAAACRASCRSRRRCRRSSTIAARCCCGARASALDEIARRTEILKGQLVVYLNLDEVIRIIREEDDPKARMMKRWKLSEVQVEAILNMRLRALRRLEEIAIKKELGKLSARAEGARGARSPIQKRQWKAVGGEIADLNKEFGARRRSASAAPRSARRRRGHGPGRGAGGARAGDGAVLGQGLDPRGASGHGLALGDIKYKEGDGPRFVDRRPRPPTSCSSSPPTAASIRSPSTSCRAGAAMASRSA